MFERWEERLQLVPGFLGVPEVEELIKSPFNALNALLLTLGCIFYAEGGRIDVGPIRKQVQIKQSKVGEKQGDVGDM